MRRRLFNFAAAVSLVLCAVSVVLWGDSLRHRDLVGGTFGTSGMVCMSVERGTLWLLGSANDEDVPWIGTYRKDLGLVGLSTGETVLGFGFPTVPGVTGIGVPLWFLLLLFLVMSFVLRAGERRIAGVGFCKCGYNLTGNVSGTCPECGTPVTKPL